MSRLRESWGDFPRPPRLTLSRTLSVNIGSYSTGKPAACQAIPPPAGSDRRAWLSPSGRPCTRNVPFIGTLPARLAPRRNMAMVREEPTWAFEHSVDCEVTAEFAWGFWTNVNNWAFDSDIESVEIDGPFAAGARGSTNSKSSGRIEWRIAEARDGRAVIEFPLSGAAGRCVGTFGRITPLVRIATIPGSANSALAQRDAVR
jgi:hypothetical protein